MGGFMQGERRVGSQSRQASSTIADTGNLDGEFLRVGEVAIALRWHSSHVVASNNGAPIRM